MQNVKQASAFKLLTTGALAFFTLVLLFSCSKDNVPTQASPEPTVAGDLGQSQGNSIVAVPFETTVFVPCANGGVGENVQLKGYTHFVYQMAWTDHGFIAVYHDNVLGVTAVGLSSGENFAVSGGTQGIAIGSWVNDQFIATTERALRVVGQNTVFTLNFKYQLIVTPDGNVNVSVREQTAECK